MFDTFGVHIFGGHFCHKIREKKAMFSQYVGTGPV